MYSIHGGRKCGPKSLGPKIQAPAPLKYYKVPFLKEASNDATNLGAPSRDTLKKGSKRTNPIGHVLNTWRAKMWAQIIGPKNPGERLPNLRPALRDYFSCSTSSQFAPLALSAM